MKNIIDRIRIIIVLCVTIGWWGLLYPELSMTPDTVQIVSENENAKDGSQQDVSLSDGSLYLDLLKAGRSKIRFRSRLLTELNAFWEAKSWAKSTEN